MKYRETNSKEETDFLYKEFLKEIGKEDSDDTYNDFYNGAEHEGYSVEMVIPLDEKLSKKYNIAIPNGHECWYELKKSRRQK